MVAEVCLQNFHRQLMMLTDHGGSLATAEILPTLFDLFLPVTVADVPQFPDGQLNDIFDAGAEAVTTQGVVDFRLVKGSVPLAIALQRDGKRDGIRVKVDVRNGF